MANMTLPTEAEVRAIDETAFTWDDLLDGTLSEVQGQVIKAVCDKMASGEVLNLVEQYAATGKTAKFINDNVTGASNLKICTSDQYVDTFLTTSDYFTNTGNAANVYKLDISATSEVVYNEGGDPTHIKYYDTYTDPSNPTLTNTIDLSETPTAMSTNEIAALTRVWPATTNPVTHDGTALGSDATAGSFNPDVWIFNPWTPNMGYPALDIWGQTRTYATTFNKMESGEVMVILNFHMPNVNQAFWAAMNPMTLNGKFWTAEYVLNTESDNSGSWQAAIIKKT